MCVIIDKPKGKRMSYDKILSACEYNEDGLGYMYICPESGELLTKRIMFTKPEDTADLLDNLFTIHSDIDVVYHLRMRTHGETNLDNVHPFQVLSKEKHGKDVFFMHNGIINITSDSPEDKDKSDTVIFNEYILQPLLENNPDFMYTHAFKELVGDYTSGSRLIFMDDEGRVVKTGKWLENEGCAVSNNNYFDGVWKKRSAAVAYEYPSGAGNYWADQYKPFTPQTPSVPKTNTANGKIPPAILTAVEHSKKVDLDDLEDDVGLMVSVAGRLDYTTNITLDDIFKMTNEEIEDLFEVDPERGVELFVSLVDEHMGATETGEYLTGRIN